MGRVSFQLVTAGAAIESDVEVRLKTWGVIPATGRLFVYMPYGFILSAGSTVAQQQLNLPGVCVCVCVCVCVWMYVYTYIYTHTIIHIYICIHW